MAAKPYSRYLYTYNNYLRFQLETFSDTAGGFSDVYKFEKVYTLDLDGELKSTEWDKPRTQKEQIERTGFLAIIKAEGWCEKYLDPFIDDYKSGVIDQMPVIIFSQWDGYVKEYFIGENGERKENRAKNQAWIDFLEKQKEKGVEIKYLHTSGHASAEMIAKVIRETAPTDEIWPMHTEHPEMFEKLDIGEYADKVVQQNENYIAGVEK